ncbi:MAG: hypothetical protein JO356_02720, partial [Acidobacteria bacterium]|nr:hypothetical protein [Acidobacteriota bacterium]
MKDQQKAHPQAASQSAATSRSELIFGDSTGDISADLSEDQVLGLLHQSGLNAALLASIARTPMAAKSRKVSIALLRHQRLPRHLSIALLRRLFTFDLVKVALSPVIAPDLKRIAEEQILLRLESLPLGERISLARRSPPRVLEGLLADGDGRVLS